VTASEPVTTRPAQAQRVPRRRLWLVLGAVAAGCVLLAGAGEAVTRPATPTDVRPDHGTVATQGVQVSAVLTPATLTARLAGEYPDASVSADAGDQSLLIRLGPGGVIQIHERAGLAGDVVRLSPSSVSVLGRKLAVTSRIADKLTVRRSLAGLPCDLAPRSVSVTPGGLWIELSAGPGILGGTGTGGGHSCRAATSSE